MRTILYAEDDPIQRKVFTRMLTADGYAVTPVGDGTQAWEAMQLARYDVVLTDEDMPCLRGSDLVRRARNAGILIPAILISAAIRDEEPDAENLFTARLKKPVSRDRMLAALRLALNW